ncbi:hypothetical protein C0134_01970 [Moraxella catarrhalis]|uniref:hypothetical protein n=1 Tax=Moraxella catarrhalis TaxID=480 RepID=UPI00128C75C3|nr:hypothetical protein [Moraxella catarrhalis]MPW82293.1 hypothetical protein [Moraxella catarrhalis]
MGLDTYLYAIAEDKDNRDEEGRRRFEKDLEKIAYWRKCYPLCDYFLSMKSDLLDEDGKYEYIPITQGELSEFLDISLDDYFNNSVLGVDEEDEYSKMYDGDIETLRQAIDRMKQLPNHNFYLLNWW